MKKALDRKKLEALRSRLYGTKTFTAGCTGPEFHALFELAECGLSMAGAAPTVKSLREGLTSTLEGLRELVGTDPLATEALGRALATLENDGQHFTLRKPEGELRRCKPPTKHLSVRASPSFRTEPELGDEYQETCGRLTLILDEEQWAAVKAEVMGQFDGKGSLAYVEMIADMQLRASKTARDEVGVEDDVDLVEAIEELVEKADVPTPRKDSAETSP